MKRSAILFVAIAGLCVAWSLSAAAQSGEKLITTKSGLKYADIREGKGAAAEKGRRVRVLYKCMLASGRVVDERSDRTKPYSFVLGEGNVIKGMDEGLVGMRVNGIRKLVIPPKLAYGAKGYPPSIPPNEQLTFQVELVGVSRAPSK
jgi:FKBP-type peptidyl-prolyl cis-trans isomerase